MVRVEWLAGWLDGWQDGWLAGGVAGRLAGWLAEPTPALEAGARREAIWAMGMSKMSRKVKETLLKPVLGAKRKSDKIHEMEQKRVSL